MDQAEWIEKIIVLVKEIRNPRIFSKIYYYIKQLIEHQDQF